MPKLLRHSFPVLILMPLLFSQLAFGAVGDLVITVTDETGASLGGVSVTINCDGVAATIEDGRDGDGVDNGTIVVLSETATGAGCSDGEVITQLDLERNGYVTTAATGDLIWNAASENANTASLPFAYKITSVITEGVNVNVADEVVILTIGDTNGQTTCRLSAGTWYCPLILANSVSAPDGIVVLDGYVQETMDLTGSVARTSHSSAQVVTSLSDLKYAHKVIAKNFSGYSLTSATVELGEVPCLENSGTYYCPVGVNLDGRVGDLTVARSSYETWVTSSKNRTVGTDAQGVYTSSNQLDFVPEVAIEEVPVIVEAVEEVVEVFVPVIPDDVYFSYAESYIIDLYEAGVVEGRDGEAFEPYAQLTRAEALKIILLARGYELIDYGSSFSDVSSQAWYFLYVITAKDAGLIQGYPDYTFRPNDPISRDEYVKMLLFQDVDISAPFESDLLDVDVDKWYAPYAEYAHDLGLDDGDLYFGPGELIDRAEAAKMASIMMD